MPPRPLPAPPAIRIELLRERPAESGTAGSFLDVRHLELVAHYPDGSSSAPFSYDVIARAALDAVIIAAHYLDGGVRHVYLRSCVRPPLALRSAPLTARANQDDLAPGRSRAGLPPEACDEDGMRACPQARTGNLWELPAGLVEPGEEPAVGAARELREELGFSVSANDLEPLGPWTLPVPAMISERHLFFSIEVDPATRAKPTEDGSALEREAGVIALPLTEVLEHCRGGTIRDEKTELAVRRLMELRP